MEIMPREPFELRVFSCFDEATYRRRRVLLACGATAASLRSARVISKFFGFDGAMKLFLAALGLALTFSSGVCLVLVYVYVLLYVFKTNMTSDISIVTCAEEMILLGGRTLEILTVRRSVARTGTNDNVAAHDNSASTL